MIGQPGGTSAIRATAHRDGPNPDPGPAWLASTPVIVWALTWSSLVVGDELLDRNYAMHVLH